jgi:hypothetical protein
MQAAVSPASASPSRPAPAPRVPLSQRSYGPRHGNAFIPHTPRARARSATPSRAPSASVAALVRTLGDGLLEQVVAIADDAHSRTQSPAPRTRTPSRTPARGPTSPARRSPGPAPRPGPGSPSYEQLEADEAPGLSAPLIEPNLSGYYHGVRLQGTGSGRTRR